MACSAAQGQVVEAVETGCRGCSSGKGGYSNIFGNKYGQYLATIQYMRELEQGLVEKPIELSKTAKAKTYVSVTSQWVWGMGCMDVCCVHMDGRIANGRHIYYSFDATEEKLGPMYGCEMQKNARTSRRWLIDRVTRVITKEVLPATRAKMGSVMCRGMARVLRVTDRARRAVWSWNKSSIYDK